MDEKTRDSLSAALNRAGRSAEAGLVKEDGTRLTTLPAPFLRTWRIIEVSNRQNAHPVLFYVGAGAGQAYLLTGDPAAFGKVTTADGSRVADTATAERLARLYLETTRDTGRLTYVVGGVNEIRFRPGITGEDAERRNAVIARYRPTIAPPQARAADGGFTVTAYTVREQELRRHTLTVTAAGAVRDKAETLVDDLPVPYTL
ncbi:hypothetical protein DPM19_15890 [Actinomadura craniellae]|uniref:Uncharacterized protein n=1 Tax=Actinomadura craniellae TaxID=2231787 RepID=A0A365H5S3_9ACTN|nr:hypothetical protein [Actinomadura craniellae]RAY14437.1 hypothetical protein DPM19_15890 [Actinomadura craniellae]